MLYMIACVGIFQSISEPESKKILFFGFVFVSVGLWVFLVCFYSRKVSLTWAGWTVAPRVSSVII